MAFQSGTKIRPELGNADYSGFARAAEIQAAAFADLGSKIGQGIEDYAKKKKKKADDKASVDFLRATGAFANMSDEQLAAGVAGAGGGSQLIADYANVTAMARAEELQADKVTAGQLANVSSQQSIDQRESAFPTDQALREQNLLRQQQIYGQSAESFPLSQQVTEAQLNNMNAGERRAAAAEVRAKELFPYTIESKQASIASTKQGTAASKAGVTMAEKKMALSETLAKQTQEQNERDYNLKVEELRLKIRTAGQGGKVSTKKLEGAQTYLDDNDLIMVDGAVYEKTGWFGGKAVEVMNPSVLNIEGMEDLRRISMNMQSGPSNAASGNFEGFSIQSEGEGGQPVASNSAVSAAALESVAQPQPTGSRMQGIYTGAQDLANAAVERVDNESKSMTENFRALPFAIADYFTSEDRPTLEEARLRNLGINPFSQAADGRLFTR